VEAPPDLRTAHVVQDLPAPVTVVGRLQERWMAWAKMGATPLVVEWIRDGFSLRPSQTWCPRPGGVVNRIWDEDQIEWTTTEIGRLMSTGAVLEVDPSFLVEISPIRLAPKKGIKKWRLIINMRHLNLHLAPRHFQMEGFGTILSLTRRHWWMVTWDLKEGYFHMKMSNEATKFTGFHWQGKTYAYQVLPFGCSHSPWAFSKVMREFIRTLRSRGLIVSSYLDDFFLTAPTRDILTRQRDEVVAPLMLELGLVRETSKGTWEPSQQVQILGLVVDSALGVVTIPAEKMADIKRLAGHISSKDVIPFRELAAVAGKILAVSRAFPFARMVTRAFYDLIDAVHRRPWEWDEVVPVSKEVREDALWLTKNLEVYNGCPAWKPTRVIQVNTDASRIGWGASCLGQSAGGLWTQKELEAWHINTLELIAILKGLKSFQDVLAHRRCSLLSDNMTAVSEVTRGGSRDPFRNKVVRMRTLPIR